jgi:hypothetical protein
VHDATLSALERRTSRYPPLSMGDFFARLFHDWDNVHGLTVDGGGVVFGAATSTRARHAGSRSPRRARESTMSRPPSISVQRAASLRARRCTPLCAP